MIHFLKPLNPLSAAFVDKLYNCPVNFMSEAICRCSLLNSSENNNIENAFITSYFGYNVSLMVDSGIANLGAVRFQNIFEAPGYADTLKILQKKYCK